MLFRSASTTHLQFWVGNDFVFRMSGGRAGEGSAVSAIWWRLPPGRRRGAARGGHTARSSRLGSGSTRLGSGSARLEGGASQA